MKKNKLFRLLTLALTLVFLCQFAVHAFAYTSDTWSDGSSTYYLDAIKNGEYIRTNTAIESATVSHTRGYVTYLDGVYNMEYTDISWRCDYGGDVRSTVAPYGYDDFHSESNKRMKGGASLFIPSTASSGTYCIRTNVTCDRITFNVFRDGIIDYSNEVYSPKSFSEEITNYKAL